MTQYIFVTGGVVSGLGKGLTSASIGALLESHGLKVALQKFDPYINVDPGTLSPFQHGEVYVTPDGAETDLDLGHYERFTSCEISGTSNYTTGKIYLTVIQRERRGDYLGKTVQVIPHITNEIKSVIHKLAADDVDVVITEIGGTVGDIESQPFLEAIRQFALQVGKENCLFIHLTLAPYLKAAGELKTKPTQQSVGQLRQIGIQPDILIVRTERPLGHENIEKIALFCNVEQSEVIEEIDKEFSIYEVPLGLVEHGLDQLIVDKLSLPAGTLDMSDWRAMLQRMRTPEHEVTIGVVGKYIEHSDAYKSIYEALTHGGIHHRARVRFRRVQAEDLAEGDPEEILGGVDGILVPGGFGERGVEGKIRTVQFARENKIPFLGVCYGMHAAGIEYCRNVLGIKEASSTEINKDTPDPVITLLDEQKDVEEKGGTMRLGTYPCKFVADSICSQEYSTLEVGERHRHRYEFNNEYRDRLTEAGIRIAGTSPDNSLVEVIEIVDHPWFVACQYHPEFQSKPFDAHPLFRGLIGASLSMKSQSDG